MYGDDNNFTIDTTNNNGFRFYNKSVGSAGFIFFPSSTLGKDFKIKPDTGISNSGENTFSGETTFQSDVIMQNKIYINPEKTESISSYSRQLILDSADTTSLKAGGVECLWLNNYGIPYVFSLNPPTHESHIITKKYVDAQALNAETKYGGKYNKLPVFVARDIGYQYQTTTLLQSNLPSITSTKLIELTNINCGMYMVELTIFFKAYNTNHGFYVEIRQPHLFTTQAVFNIPSLPGVNDPNLPNLPPLILTPNMPNYPFGSGSGGGVANAINNENVNSSGVFQLSSSINNFSVICKTSLMFSAPINGYKFEAHATSSHGGNVVCGSMVATRIA